MLIFVQTRVEVPPVRTASHAIDGRHEDLASTTRLIGITLSDRAERNDRRFGGGAGRSAAPPARDGRRTAAIAPAPLLGIAAVARCRSRGVEQVRDPVTGCRGRDGLAVRVDIGRIRAVS
jgi:hypothetical protein